MLEVFFLLDAHLFHDGFNILRVLVVPGLKQLVLPQVLHLKLVDDLLGVLDCLFVFLGRRVVDDLLNLDVLTFDLLNAVTLLSFVLPVLVELREAGSHIVDE